MKIVITGSLGHIGKPLAEELVRKGHAVTVISSKTEKAKDIQALGAAPAIGSVEDAAFLAETFAGADAVFTMVPPNFGATPDQLGYYKRVAGHYAQAIAQAGVKRVVNLSSYGAHLDSGTGIILGAHHAENILNGLPEVSITHLRPGYFYYNLYNFTGMIKAQGIIGSNYGGDDRLMLVAPGDIATVAAEELQAATGAGVRYIVSDDRSANDVARVLGAAIGKPDLQWLVFSDEQTTEGLKQSGMPAAFVPAFVELGASIHNGRLREDYDRHQPIEEGAVKLEDFAKEFAAAF